MKVLNVAIVVWINSKDKIYLQTRCEKGSLNGFLEFPGGKIEQGEDSMDAARREFCEETPFILSDAAILTLFNTYNYTYPDRKVSLNVYTLNDGVSS